MDIVNLELEQPSETDFEAIKLMLMSTDPESFVLGFKYASRLQLMKTINRGFNLLLPILVLIMVGKGSITPSSWTIENRN